MQNLLNKFIQNDFADFEGLQIAGVIPIRQEVVNEVIAEVLQNGLPATKSAEPQPQATAPAPPIDAAPQKPQLDPNTLLNKVKMAEVEMHEGKVLIKFQLAV